jgi:hypothetical protein
MTHSGMTLPPTNPPLTTPPLVPPFRVGQVWTYHTRPSEPKSRLTILKIDQDPTLGPIVHVRVTAVQVRNPRVEAGVTPEIGHLPFAAEALSRSVIGKISDYGPLGDFQGGYAQWNEAFTSGRGGIWSLSVAETLDAMEQALKG